MVKDNYPSMHQKKSLIKDPSMHKNFLDRWECVHEGGGRRQRQKTDAAFRLFAPQSTIHCQQATSPRSQYTMPDVIPRFELSLATCRGYFTSSH